MSPSGPQFPVQMKVMTSFEVVPGGDCDLVLLFFFFYSLSDNLIRSSEAPLRVCPRAFEGQLFPARVCLDSGFRSSSSVAISVCVIVQFEMLSSSPTEFSGLESFSSRQTVRFISLSFGLTSEKA